MLNLGNILLGHFAARSQAVIVFIWAFDLNHNLSFDINAIQRGTHPFKLRTYAILWINGNIELLLKFPTGRFFHLTPSLHRCIISLRSRKYFLLPYLILSFPRRYSHDRASITAPHATASPFKPLL